MSRTRFSRGSHETSLARDLAARLRSAPRERGLHKTGGDWLKEVGQSGISIFYIESTGAEETQAPGRSRAGVRNDEPQE